MCLLNCALYLLLPRYVVFQCVKAAFSLEFKVLVRQNRHAEALDLEESNPDSPRLEHSLELKTAKLELEPDHPLPSLLVLVMNVDP